MNQESAMTNTGKNLRTFFGLVLLISLPIYILVASVPSDMVMFMGLALAVAPISAALILVYRENQSTGVKRLLKRAFDYNRIKYKTWYVPIVFLFPLLFGLAMWITIITGAPLPDPIAPVVAAPVFFLVFFLFAIFEELGWMGYAYDPMGERWNGLTASLILGGIWAIWHLPLYIFADFELLWSVGQLFSLVAIRILIVWIYKNTGLSVFATILFHTIYNVCTLMFPSFSTASGHLYTSALIILSAAFVVYFWGAGTLAKIKLRDK